MEDFVATLTSKTSKARLLFLFKRYPQYIQLKDSGVKELWCARRKLRKDLDTEHPTFNFDSFERGLKNGGLAVIESTHGRTKWKKWVHTKYVVKKKKKAKRGQVKRRCSERECSERAWNEDIEVDAMEVGNIVAFKRTKTQIPDLLPIPPMSTDPLLEVHLPNPRLDWDAMPLSKSWCFEGMDMLVK